MKIKLWPAQIKANNFINFSTLVKHSKKKATTDFKSFGEIIDI